MAELSDEIGSGMLVDAYVVDVGERDPRLLKAVGNRLGGKARPMLDAVEPFLLYGHGEFTVNQQSGGRVSVISVQAQNCGAIRHLYYRLLSGSDGSSRLSYCSFGLSAGRALYFLATIIAVARFETPGP